LLNKETICELVSDTQLSRQNKILLLLCYENNMPKKVSDIKKIAHEVGLRIIDKWNVSDILYRAKGLVARVSDGWILTNKGKIQVSTITGISFNGQRSAVGIIIKDLYVLVSKISDTHTKSFLNEALSCFEAKNYRASVVLSWVGAISILYKHVIANHLQNFNIEAARRDPKWRPAKTADDLSRMKEKDFLNILQAISVLGKNVKQELDGCLALRNACGHPNSLIIGENRVAAHLEILILNVYSKYV